MICSLCDLEDGTKFRFTQCMPHLEGHTHMKGTNPRWGKAVYTSMKSGEQFRCTNQDREVTVILNCITCGVEYEDDGFVHCEYCHGKEADRVEEKSNDT